MNLSIVSSTSVLGVFYIDVYNKKNRRKLINDRK